MADPLNPPIGGGEGERMSGERLTVSGDCLLMLRKMAPRNVMPSLFICTSYRVSTVLQFYSLFFVLLHTHAQSLL